MPKIDLETLSERLSAEEMALVRRIVATQGKNKGSLRAAKPKVVANDLESGKAAYLWRMVAFSASPLRQHMCLPVMADFDITAPREERKRIAKDLDALANIVLDVIPRAQHHGTRAWGRALGYW